MNKICLNCKRVFAIEPKECICGRKTFQSTEAKAADTGTITWFKCSEQLPPKEDSSPFRYSIPVLATDGIEDGNGIEVTVYCHNPAIGNPYWHLHRICKPTHWAYINYPE